MSERSIELAYAELGIPERYATLDETSPDTFDEILAHAQKHLSGLPYDLSPTRFDPVDPALLAFPRPLSWSWNSAERALKKFGGPGLMMRLPLFWQVEIPLFRAGESAGSFMFVNDQDNMPLGAAAIERASVHTVVTDAEDAAMFVAYLEAHSQPLPNAWIIVHRFDRTWNLPPSFFLPGRGLAQEVHLFPGLVVLEQCERLIEERSPLFHASDDCAIECAEQTFVSVSSPLPIVRYRLPITLQSGETCACGRETFARR